jgi:hypothetical protein
MVTSNLLGGLGNYMFQMTTAYSVALDNGDDAIFNINEGVKVHQHLETYLDNILRNITFVEKPLPIKNSYSEPFFHYNPIPYTTDLKLNGYYQSEKYFKHNREKILNLYSVDESSLKYISNKYSNILDENTCSLHVRRGDYVGLVTHHPPCNMGYYTKALEEFPEDTKFLIFSDDIAWCKEVFDGDQFHFIEGNTDYIDMWLMSMCKNNITANSSFSWWGAWLNQNQDKKVIVPNKWFGPAINHNTNDLIPDTWKRL